MTDHIKTVTLTPAEQMREAAAQVAKSRCDKCGGEGWLWGHELKDYEHPYPGQQDDTKYSCDGEECMTSAAIRALPLPPNEQCSAKACAEPAVRVKPLVWHKSHMKPWNDDWHTIPTNCTVRCADENGWIWSHAGGFGYSATPEAAKAAAQAYYEARIMAALDVSPEPDQWQPIETAPRDGTRVVLWRGFPKLGLWSEMIVAQWFDGEWCWPDIRDNPTTHGEWSEEDLVDGYADSAGPTHWMPLPAAPKGGE